MNLVDRERELAIIKKIMDNTKNGRGATVLITGDIGIGKTRLAEEFMEMCQREGFVVLSSICVGNNQPAFLPVTMALQNYAKKVCEHPEMYVPIGLAGFQSLEIERSNPKEIVKERTRMLEHLHYQFTGISKQKPVIFVIDDMHLADSATLAFFHYMARNVFNESIILVATFVEEFARSTSTFAETIRNLNIERLCTMLKIENFNEREVQLFVAQMGFPDSKEFVKYVYERTSGNPLFIIEFLSAIQNAGLKDLEAIKKMSLPKNVKDIVRFRVSTLSEKTKKVLATASVLGRVFEYAVLKELVGLNEEELLDALDELISQNFLMSTEEFEEGYKFVSNTTCEVLYSDIIGMRRKLMHQRAAEVIEQFHGSDEQFWSSLAWHYKESGDKTKFLEYALRAGRSAARRFANAEAIEHFKGALEVLGETPEELKQKIGVMWELAEVLDLDGRYEEALGILDKRISCTAISNPVEAGKSHRKKAEIFIYKGDYDDALGECEKAEEFLIGLPEEELELARAWSVRGVVYERKGEYLKGIEWQNRALQVFEKIKAEKDVGNALNKIGLCLWCLGDYEKSLEQYQKSLAIREKIGDLRGMAMCYNNIGLIYDAKGDYKRAFNYYEKSLAICEKIGDVWGISISYNNIGLSYYNAGDYEKAVDYYEKGLAICKKIGDTYGLGIFYNNIGLIHSSMGNYLVSLEYYEKGLAICENVGDLWGIALISTNIGTIYGRSGDYKKAMDYLEKSLAISKKIGDVMGIARTYSEIAIIYKEKEEYDLALKYFQESLKLYRQIRNEDMIATECLYICDTYIDKSEIGLAREHLKEGKKHLGELSDKRLIAYSNFVEGKLLGAEGRTEESKKFLRSAIEMYEKIKLQDIEYYMALFELGKIERNKDLLRKAVAFFEKIGNTTWIERANKVLKNLE
ncbi:MAG: tetratricopeptide repeat protein [Thermoplasmata archaeon]